MSHHRAVLAAFVVAAIPAVAFADDSPGVRLGEPTKSTWRFGVVVKAAGGPVSGIVATMPVPMDWPEQTVKVVSEEKSPGVGRVSTRVLDGGVKQLVVSIPRLAAGQEASFVQTTEVSKRPILEPVDVAMYSAPAKNSRELAKFLLPSPYIESNSPKIKQRAGEVTAGKAPGWEQVAAAFDWVRENVKYEFAEQIKPAVAALEDGQGDCEELSSLVIALCRASKIPARAVWVPGHCYPEFYLVDEQGKGHWFPCQAAGEERQFGSMVEERPILQKGDNFKVPEERGAQRYVKQALTAKDAAAPPEVRFIMERVP
jgi:hypothetical protein